MPDAAGRYIDYAFLTKFWGTQQIDSWADTDSDNVRGPADDLVIQEAIDDAEDDIDAHLAAAYATPFTGPIPRMLKKIARLRAGVYLYARRGLREGADPAGQMKSWLDISDRMLAELRTGKVLLPGRTRSRSSALRTPASADPCDPASADRAFRRDQLPF